MWEEKKKRGGGGRGGPDRHLHMIATSSRQFRARTSTPSIRGEDIRTEFAKIKRLLRGREKKGEGTEQNKKEMSPDDSLFDFGLNPRVES